MRWLGLLPAWFTLTALGSSQLPVIGKLIVGGVVVLTVWNPSEGFLLAAGLAPLGALLATIFDIDAFRLSEAVVLAFLAGWLLRGHATAKPQGMQAPAPPPYTTRAAWLFAALVGASIAGLGWQIGRTSNALAPALAALARTYYSTDDPFGAVGGARLLEGIGLFAATILLFQRRPRLAIEIPGALAASAAVAALAGLLVWRGLGPLPLLQQYARSGYRVAAHVGDVNAAGSYFVLVLGLSLGMSVRQRGPVRALWMAASVLCATGLWLSESRTAFAAAAMVMPLAALWAASANWRPKARGLAIAVLILTAVGAGALMMMRLERDSTYLGSGFRTQFAAASARMIAARPVFGIGVGRYYPESFLFLSPKLAWTYGFENAHNNFLQVAGETGLVGFALFATMIVGGLGVGARALVRASHDWRLLGTFAGVLGFLGTCLAGHPLLVPEVAFPFWIQFGLLVGLGSSTLMTLEPERHVRWPRPALRAATAVVAVLIAVSVPVRAFRASPSPSTSPAVDGFYEWETGPDKVAFRWTGEYASLFVPAGTTAVDIPARAPKEGGRFNPLSVEVGVGGVPQGRFELNDSWTHILLPLTPASPPVLFRRIDLHVGRTWRPALVVPGSAEMRSVGVQVGRISIPPPPPK